MQPSGLPNNPICWPPQFPGFPTNSSLLWPPSINWFMVFPINHPDFWPPHQCPTFMASLTINWFYCLPNSLQFPGLPTNTPLSWPPSINWFMAFPINHPDFRPPYRCLTVMASPTINWCYVPTASSFLASTTITQSVGLPNSSLASWSSQQSSSFMASTTERHLTTPTVSILLATPYI